MIQILTQNFDDKNNDKTYDLELTEKILKFLESNPKSTILTISKSCDVDSYRCSQYLDFLEYLNLIQSSVTLDGIKTSILTASGIKYLQGKGREKKEPTLQEQKANKIEEISYNLLHRYPFQTNSKANSSALDVYLSEEWQNADKTIQNYCHQRIAECTDEDVESVKKLMIEILGDYIRR